jgi:hemin uptake protein HemP
MEAQTKPPLSNSPPDSTAARPLIESEQILRGNSTVEIEHAGQRYLLRVTRENKLILTK